MADETEAGAKPRWIIQCVDCEWAHPADNWHLGKQLIAHREDRQHDAYMIEIEREA